MRQQIGIKNESDYVVLIFIVVETTGFAGGGLSQKALASSVERSEIQKLVKL